MTDTFPVEATLYKDAMEYYLFFLYSTASGETALVSEGHWLAVSLAQRMIVASTLPPNTER